MTRKLVVRLVTSDSYAVERGLWEYRFTDWRGQTIVSPWFDSEDKTIAGYFSSHVWPGGYAIAYFSADDNCSGVTLCASCARQEWQDDGTVWEGQSTEGDPSSSGMMCDGCNEWIVEPVCVECCDELSTVRGPLFHDDAGDMVVCRTCINKLMTKGYAYKTGRMEYVISPDYAWYVHSNPFRADCAVRL